jgi:hypothetical protein
LVVGCPTMNSSLVLLLLLHMFQTLVRVQKGLKLAHRVLLQVRHEAVSAGPASLAVLVLVLVVLLLHIAFVIVVMAVGVTMR